MASARNWVRTWPLVAPRARRSPISERRSRTGMIMMLASPIAPHEQGDGAEASEEVVEGAFGVALGDQSG